MSSELLIIVVLVLASCALCGLLGFFLELDQHSST